MDISTAKAENPISKETLGLLIDMLNWMFSHAGGDDPIYIQYKKEAFKVWVQVTEAEKEALGRDEAILRCFKEIKEKVRQLAKLRETVRRHEELVEHLTP